LSPNKSDSPLHTTDPKVPPAMDARALRDGARGRPKARTQPRCSARPCHPRPAVSPAGWVVHRLRGASPEAGLVPAEFRTGSSLLSRDLPVHPSLLSAKCQELAQTTIKPEGSRLPSSVGFCYSSAVI